MGIKECLNVIKDRNYCKKKGENRKNADRNGT